MELAAAVATSNDATACTLLKIEYSYRYKQSLDTTFMSVYHAAPLAMIQQPTPGWARGPSVAGGGGMGLGVGSEVAQ